MITNGTDFEPASNIGDGIVFMKTKTITDGSDLIFSIVKRQFVDAKTHVAFPEVGEGVQQRVGVRELNSQP